MKRPAFAVPAPVSAVLRRLPEGPPARAIAMALNAGLAAGWVERGAFEPLAGRRLRIEASDAGGVTLTLGRRGFAPARGAPDAVIRARLADFARLALRREDPDTLFFSRRLVIEGDAELGLHMKNALDALDWDRLPRPMPALLRRLSRLPRGA